MFDRLFRRKLAVATADDLAKGREFDRGDLIDQRYQVLDVRQGAMGVVYIAMDRSIEQRVAIKSFQSKFLWNEQAISYFHDEATVWIKLGSHPNIVQAFAVREFAGRPHVIAEFVDGYSLRALVGAVEQRQALDLAIATCWAMTYAHERGLILHRDIKPDNVMVSRRGVVKVTDFGLARAIPSNYWSYGAEHSVAPTGKPRNDTAGGTPQYMAPELFKGAFTIGPWVDIYAFGVMLFELLTGALPLCPPPGGKWAEAHQQQALSDPRQARPELHRGFAHVIGHCVASDPMRRYRSFATLEADLQLLRQHLAGSRLEPAASQQDPAARAEQLHSQGVAHLSLGDPHAALLSFRQANRLRPDEPAFWLDTALASITLWHDQDALAACEAGLARGPEANLAARLERARGQALVRSHRTLEALAAYERSLKLNPVDSQTHLARGELLLALNRREEALQSFEAATRYDRLAPKGWRSLGAAQLEAGRPREALAAYDAALRLDPRDGDSWRQRGTSLFLLRRYPQAAEAFALALKLDPDDSGARAGLREAQNAGKR